MKPNKKFYKELTTDELVQHRKRLGKQLEEYTRNQRVVYDEIQKVDKELKIRIK